MKEEDKKYFKLTIILLAFVIATSLILRIWFLNIVNEHGLQDLFDDALIVSNFLLLVCVGLGLLNIMFFIYLWFEERKPCQ